MLVGSRQRYAIVAAVNVGQQRDGINALLVPAGDMHAAASRTVGHLDAQLFGCVQTHVFHPQVGVTFKEFLGFKVQFTGFAGVANKDRACCLERSYIAENDHIASAVRIEFGLVHGMPYALGIAFTILAAFHLPMIITRLLFLLAEKSLHPSNPLTNLIAGNIFQWIELVGLVNPLLPLGRLDILEGPRIHQNDPERFIILIAWMGIEPGDIDINRYLPGPGELDRVEQRKGITLLGLIEGKILLDNGIVLNGRKRGADRNTQQSNNHY